MATDQHRQPPARAPADAGQDVAGKEVACRPSGFARLARQITAVTTNCLLTALVVVAGLGFGRQVLKWWREDAAGPQTSAGPLPVADGLGDLWRSHLLQFGDQPWSFRRQSIPGDRQAASEALRKSCRRLLAQAPLPGDDPTGAEQQLLARLAASDPVAQRPGTWQLHELQEPFPMVVGIRQIAPGEGTRDATGPPGAPARIVAWGWAIPAGDRAWTLWIYGAREADEGGESALSAIPIPPECSRILGVCVAGGGATLAFEGPPRPKTWMHFYGQWFTRHNWKAAGDWQRRGSAWHQRYTSQEGGSTTCVDVRFAADGRGRFVGLLMATPFGSGSPD